MDKRIYLCLAHMSGKEQGFIKEAFDTNWVVPLGPNVNAFEEELESFVVENKKVVALSAGTAAIHLALIQLGVQAGDEVGCQTFTFCASANPVTYLGATPVFVDSEEDTWNMSPVLLEEAIKDRMAKTGKKPKAIIPVHLYGMPAKIDEICAIAEKYDIPVLEDAAEALGSEFKGHKCGTFGTFGALSFNGNKMITTSGGGALIVADEDAKKQTMYYATQAREPFPYYQHEHIGYNYRINSKVELVQVPYARETIQPRTYIKKDMIGTMNVPKSFLVGNYYTNINSIVGKYSNYNTIIAKGSLFYSDLVVSGDELPDSAFADVPEGYTVINYPVTIASTYANSMAPGSHINIYYKSLNDNGEVMFGKFISNIEVLDVKDSSGQHVFENSDETRTPAYMLFAVPEETHLLLRKALYLDDYDVELILIPNTATLTEKDTVTVSSHDIEEFINSKTVFVSVDDLPNITDKVTENNTNTYNNTNTNNNTQTNG